MLVGILCSDSFREDVEKRSRYALIAGGTPALPVSRGLVPPAKRVLVEILCSDSFKEDVGKCSRCALTAGRTPALPVRSLDLRHPFRAASCSFVDRVCFFGNLLREMSTLRALSKYE